MLTRPLPMPVGEESSRLRERAFPGQVFSQPRLNPAGERTEIRDSLEFIIG
jgi:hypothetical protein